MPGTTPQLIEKAARLPDEGARRRFLEAHSELRSAEGVRVLQVAARELAAREPRLSLGVAEMAGLAARGLDLPTRLIARRALAQAHHAMARHVESARLHQELAEAYLREGQPLQAASALLASVGDLTYVGRPREALDAARRARSLYRKAGDRLGEAKVDTNFGIVYHRLDRFRDALACFRRARPFFARRGERATVAVIDMNRALAHSMQGRQRSAARLFASARDSFEALGRTLQVAIVDYNEAYDHFLNGRYDEAWSEMERARAAHEKLGDRLGVALAELDLAEMALALGEPRLALGFARGARSGFEALDIGLETARARCLEAVALARTQSGDQARVALEEAAAAFDSEGLGVRAALARLDLAALNLDRDPGAAASLARASRARLARAGHRNAEVRSFLIEGLALLADSPARARRLLAQAAARARRQAVPDVGWQATAALARLDLAEGRRASARRRLEAAVTEVDRVRAEVRRADLAGWFLADRMQVYENAMRAALAAGGATGNERAFLYAERARSRALADALATAGALPRRPHRAEAEGRRIRTLRQRLDRSYRLLLHHRRAAVADDALAARISRDEQALARALGPHVGLAGEATTWTRPEVDRLKGALTPEQRLLAWQRLGDELWAFVLSPEGVSATRLTRNMSEVDEGLEELGYQISKFNLGEDYAKSHSQLLQRGVDRVLERLGRLLLGRVKHEVLGRPLIVVPHEKLHHLPLAALRLDGRYLAETTTTSTAPSAVAFRLLADRHRRGRRAPLVVGVGDASTPWVRREAEEVAGLWPGSRLLLGEEASGERLVREVAGRRVIHIATHGLFRPQQPALSGLLLSDGWLTLHDVFTLRLEADLVAVAACHSGMSHVGAGDELLGLTRGFLHAGAASVLVSQWAVDDLSARHLMLDFYRGYRRGRAKAEALREAMLAEMKRRPHPYYWASFALAGTP